MGQLAEGAKFIHEAVRNNKKIYIHCKEGISRAPCFLVAYLIKYESMNIRDAIQLIRRKRYFINILPEQIDRINEFEKIMRNFKS